MGKLFENIQPAVKEETKKLVIFVSVMTIIMWVAFFVLHQMQPEFVPFDYTVFLGGIGGSAVAVLNFFLMGISVQGVVSADTEDSAKNKMKVSYTYRTLMQMLWVVLAIVLPCFHWIAGILPVLFPGIWFKFRLIIKK